MSIDNFISDEENERILIGSLRGAVRAFTKPLGFFKERRRQLEEWGETDISKYSAFSVETFKLVAVASLIAASWDYTTRIIDYLSQH